MKTLTILILALCVGACVSRTKVFTKTLKNFDGVTYLVYNDLGSPYTKITRFIGGREFTVGESDNPQDGFESVYVFSEDGYIICFQKKDSNWCNWGWSNVYDQEKVNETLALREKELQKILVAPDSQ